MKHVSSGNESTPLLLLPPRNQNQPQQYTGSTCLTNSSAADETSSHRPHDHPLPSHLPQPSHEHPLPPHPSNPHHHQKPPTPFGPRTILRALSSPLLSHTLFTSRDPHVGRPRRQPLLVREPHVGVDETEAAAHPHHDPEEKLNPPRYCESRKSTFFIALFNLVATVCGGGVLSLPLVFARAGIGPTTILMILGAWGTDAALQRLVDAARQTGSRSYGDVAQAAFGKGASIVTTATLAVMLVGSLIAFLVLTRDVWAPVLFAIVPGLSTVLLWLVGVNRDEGNDTAAADDDDMPRVDRRAANALLLIILVAALPLMLQRELYALRHACYVGFASCVTLCAAICLRAVQRVRQDMLFPSPSTTTTLNWWSTDPADWLFAFPIVALCFFCSYNVLPVHSQLLHPTRHRIGWVLRGSLLLCLVLFYAVGLGGYLYAHPYTPDNIITAFPMDDWYVLAGRTGYCLTLLFGVPLILLPCREAWVSLPSLIQEWRHDRALVRAYQRKHAQGGPSQENAQHFVVNGVDFDEPYSFFRRQGLVTGMVAASSGTATSSSVSSEEDSLEEGRRGGLASTNAVAKHQSSLQSVAESSSIASVSSVSRRGDQQNPELLVATPPSSQPTPEPSSLATLCPGFCPTEDQWSHWIATGILLSVTYVTAISVPGVAAVWSIFGSSMAIFIAFVVPTACYLQILKHRGWTGKAIIAALLLAISLAAMVLCTHQAVSSALDGTL